MTNKTRRFQTVIIENPGITAAELHRRVGGNYAHGHHKYTYETVTRMLRNRLIERCAPAEGLRGVGLRAIPVVAVTPIMWRHSDKTVTTIGC
jgi:hypothetical protein